MNAVVIKHVSVDELPSDWRDRVNAPANTKVTVRIEEETVPEEAANNDGAQNPMFGMWSDREDMANVEAYVRKLRAPRYT